MLREKGLVRLRRVMSFLLTTILSGVFLSGLQGIAFGYAGFSRNYDFPCDFCHIQWPKLNDQGNFFKDRGFMLSTTGKANGLDMMFTQPSDRDYFPVGFHMSMAYEGSALYGIGTPASLVKVGNADSQISPLSLGGSGSPGNGVWGNGANSNTVWDLLSGGLINPGISYWVQPGSEGPVFGNSPVFGIQKLWVRFDDLFGTTLFNLYAGKTSLDSPFSNKRALQIGEATPYTMYDYVPGTPEVALNSNNTSVGFGTAGLSAYYDSDSFQMKSDHVSLRYFGYLFENGCGSDQAFSVDPCESRVSVSLIPNSTLYGIDNPIESSPAFAETGIPVNNNGFNVFVHMTQSFGGWGSTNGERIGVFALVGESASRFSGGGAAAPDAVFNREGIDLSANPFPDGRLNIFGAWDIVSDPRSAIVANPAIFSSMPEATSGLEYMSWFVEADWQPSFSGFFSESGTNSNMIILTYNQLSMLHQPTFNGISQQLPSDFDNVLSFDLMDRYWLWGSDRTAISLFAEWQWMLNEGVGSAAVQSGTVLKGFGSILNAFSEGNYFNVEANNLIVGVDFSY